NRVEQSLDLREEHVLVEGRVVSTDGGDAAALAIDAITVDVGRPGAGHHLPIPMAAWTMQGFARGREVTPAGRRLAFGKPAPQVFEPIDQADTQFDGRGRLVLSPPMFPSTYMSLALWGRAGWGRLARPEELRDLAGPVVTDQQATVGGLGDGQ